MSEALAKLAALSGQDPNALVRAWVHTETGSLSNVFTRARQRPPVEDSTELQRIIALERRAPIELGNSLESDALVELMTRRLSRWRPTGSCACASMGRDCITRLNPVQAWMLYEAPLADGPLVVLKLLDDLRKGWIRPDGEELVDPLSVARSACELACGFFYHWKFPRGESRELICLMRDPATRVARAIGGAGTASLLFDPSGGRGIEPARWPCFTPSGVRMGYAGGIKPHTIEKVLSAIGVVDSPFWLDMESGVRTDDKFDLALVRKALENAAPYVGHAPSCHPYPPRAAKRAETALPAPQAPAPVRRRVASAVIVRTEHGGERRVLLAMRDGRSGFPNLWECPGGKVESGENDIDALRRELAEELGVHSIRIDPTALGAVDLDPPLVPAPFVVTFYRVDISPDNPPAALQSRCLAWFEPAALDSIPLMPANRALIEQVKAELLPPAPVQTQQVPDTNDWHDFHGVCPSCRAAMPGMHTAGCQESILAPVHTHAPPCKHENMHACGPGCESPTQTPTAAPAPAPATCPLCGRDTAQHTGRQRPRCYADCTDATPREKTECREIARKRAADAYQRGREAMRAECVAVCKTMPIKLSLECADAIGALS